MSDPSALTRRRLLGGSLALGAGALLPGKAPAQGGAKPLSGVTLNVSTFSTPYPTFLKKILPEFEAATGAKVNYDTPAFPVYNQRADLELSTRGSAYDVVNVTYIYSSRWIESGWLTPLDEYVNDPALTPADWELGDFLSGTLAPERNRAGQLFGIPWNVEVVITGASRFDLVREAGLAYPNTIDEFRAAIEAVNRKQRVAGFANSNHHGWTFVPYLHAFGADVFRDAPNDLLPTLDTPEAIAAADYYAALLRDFGPDGVLGYTSDQVVHGLKTGRTNFSSLGQTYLSQIGDQASSRTIGTSAFGLVPAGPAGRFPGIAVHGFGIPIGSKNKAAAWEFIKWASSKEVVRRAVVEGGYGSPTRLSAIRSPEFTARQTINGHDVADLTVQSIAIAEKTGHMKYRTVPIYPQVNQQLNKAIESIASGQLSAAAAMKLAQAQAIADIRRAGVAL